MSIRLFYRNFGRRREENPEVLFFSDDETEANDTAPHEADKYTVAYEEKFGSL